jgi:hypothetical protein
MSSSRGNSVRWDIVVPTKHAMAGGATGDLDILRLGRDWSGAAFVLTLRPAEGGTGSALVTLTNQSAGTQGISATYDAGETDPDTGLVVGGTTIVPQIDEATMEALSWGSTPTDEPLVLSYDLLVTPSGEPQRQVLFGSFTIYPGVGD